MDKNRIVDLVVIKLASKTLGKEIIIEFQKIIPRLEKLKPQNILYFIKDFQKKYRLNDAKVSILIEKLIKIYKFHQISKEHLKEFQKITQDSKLKQYLKHLDLSLKN